MDLSTKLKIAAIMAAVLMAGWPGPCRSPSEGDGLCGGRLISEAA